MSVGELLETVKLAGGILELDGDKLRCRLPKDSAHLTGLLREHKQALIAILRARGGRVATFPHCPKCASFALYRRNNIGSYECETCGLKDIDETAARRVQ
jgi:Zn ribbon nucleic-acid-binding protein